MKNLLYWILATSLFPITSCSSSLIYPPSQKTIQKFSQEIANDPDSLLQFSISSLPKNEQMAFMYLQAEDLQKKNNDKAACLRYKNLANNKLFPNAQLSLIHSLGVCDYSAQESLQIWNYSLKEVNSAFKKIFLQKSIALAQKHQQLKYLVQFSIEYTNYLDTKEQKEKFLLSLHKKIKKKYSAKEQLENNILDKLYSIAPRLIPKPKFKEYKKIAKDFSRVRQFKKARSFYTKIIHHKKTELIDKIEAYYQYAFSFKLQRDKDTYSNELEKLIKWLEKQPLLTKKANALSRYWEIRIEMSKAFWTIDYRTKASEQLLSVIKDPTSPKDVRAMAYLTLGLIELEKNNTGSAEKLLLSGLKQKQMDEKTLQDLSWNLAWTYYIGGQYFKAEAIFVTTLEKTQNESFKRKLTFWQAKALKKLGKIKRAKELWKSLIDQSSFDYYAIVSSIEIGSSLERISSTVAQENLYTPQQSIYPILDWLVAYQDWDLAEEYIRNLQKTHTSTQEIKSLLPLYHFAKWYDGGIFKFYRISPEEREETLKSHILAAFPMPFKNEFIKAQQRFGVPASFLFSIARQESSFNEHARSWADAFGVLQVTPENATRLAQKYSISYKNYSDLYRPEVNIPIGSALLKNLLAGGRATFISSVASYNAGKKPVNSWYKVRYRKDPIEFIEMVPYRETRKYLKLVLRNFVTYKRLLGENVQLKRDFFTKKFIKQ